MLTRSTMSKMSRKPSSSRMSPPTLRPMRSLKRFPMRTSPTTLLWISLLPPRTPSEL